MITAKRAREQSDSIVTSKRSALLETIESEIKTQISKGGYCADFAGTIGSNEKKYLEQLGYEVKRGSQYNESYFTVKW